MADAYNCRRGGSGGSGGGSELVIVGGTTSPAKANHNTIWLNTPNTITSCFLSDTEPAGPVEGMAWITIGASGAVKMTAPVGDEWITVYPISAKQYVSGAWVDVEAKSYQDGEWVEWIPFLYNKGNECTDITGGWVAIGKQYDGGTANSYAPTLTKNADGMHIVQNGGGTNRSGIVWPTNSIDLTDYKKVWAKVSSTSTAAPSNLWTTLAVFPESFTYLGDSRKATTPIPNTGESEIYVEVSGLSGKHRIGFTMVAVNASYNLTVHEVWLEK